MRLIDADALKEHYNVPDAEGVFSYCDTIMRVIDSQPTIKAEPIVRCGECRYREPNGHCTQFADDHIIPSVSDFCSAGARMDGGAENDDIL